VEHIFWLARHRSPLRALAAFNALTLPDPPRVLRSSAGQVAIAGVYRAMLAADELTHRLTHREPDSMTRQLGNAELLTSREVPAFCFDYHPDMDALAANRVPWRLATGRDSVGKPYHRPAHVLAQRIGVPVVEFPGGHTPYLHQPEEFTTVLTSFLAELGP
jgi:pimeloyl-ACP methyl ester carboxylesterase